MNRGCSLDPKTRLIAFFEIRYGVGGLGVCMRNEVFVLLYYTYYIIQICLNPIKSSLLSSRMGNNNRTAKCTVIFATLAIQGPNPNHRVRESQKKANGIELPGKDRGDTHQTDVR